MVIWSLTYTHQVDGEWQWSGDYAPRDAWCHVIRTSAPFVQWRGIKLPETSALSPMETSHHHSSLCSQQFFVFRYAQEEHRHLEKILYVIYDLWVYLQDDQQSFCHKSFRVGALEIILSLPVFLSVFLRELIATRPWNYPTSFRIGTSFLRSTGRAWSVAQSVITSLMLSLK